MNDSKQQAFGAFLFVLSIVIFFVLFLYLWLS